MYNQIYTVLWGYTKETANAAWEKKHTEIHHVVLKYLYIYHYNSVSKGKVRPAKLGVEVLGMLIYCSQYYSEQKLGQSWNQVQVTSGFNWH